MIEDMMPPPGHARIVPQKTQHPQDTPPEQTWYLDDNVSTLYDESLASKGRKGSGSTTGALWQKVKGVFSPGAPDKNKAWGKYVWQDGGWNKPDSAADEQQRKLSAASHETAERRASWNAWTSMR